LKALSIRQPWAWAIFGAGKDVENRTWKSSVRGTIAVHAAKTLHKRGYEDYIECMAPGENPPPPYNELERGAIIGVVDIIGCHDPRVDGVHPSPWYDGDFAFILENPRMLTSPIHCGGALNFWNVPPHIEIEIQKQLTQTKQGEKNE